MNGIWLRGKLLSNRGEITLWAVIGGAILLVAYVTNPEWFSGFFDWFWGNFNQDLNDMKNQKQPDSKLNITNP